MLPSFKKFISSNNLLSGTNTVLLTVSGGIDSIVMCHLFSEAKITFAIAHCNFKLRGKESDGDETFVKQFAKELSVPFYSTTFNTGAFAKEKNISIQMAARELRYEWFEEIRKKNKYDFIATAHHKGDVAETLLINLTRGTGIHGLHGILPKQNKIVRPLLFAAKDEIIEYAKQHKLKHREDSSNTSDKYIRNNIRLNVIPQLKKINPSIENTLYETARQLGQAESVLNTLIEKCKTEVLQKQQETYIISIKKLQHFTPVEFYLYEIINPFGFNGDTVKNIASALKGESGKMFYSEKHSLLIDRDNLVIHRLVKRGSHAYSFTKDSDAIKAPLNIRFKKTEYSSNVKIAASKKISCFDYDKLSATLTIRKWKEGDSFTPLGMKGKKKLSDFFVDNKFSLYDKENTWLMLSGNDIIWVIGHRLDDRYKVTPATQHVLVCEVVS